ncbi:diguanylate cyclase [Paenibacillus tritici]|uniref:histidine kinase N-terminal 7TM domain-containing diguanylate cyclase n=1 Tax=Paenibacillus tritici TaxID=1873425 RepID=UPI001BAC176B|nr:diguanylate cyclase [Paenibacillus tritici]QUL54843.1 diguanylate cyclase [Paenibacillus tritici]
MALASWIDLIMCFILFLLLVYIVATVNITNLHKVYLGFHFSMLIWPYCQFAIRTVDDPVFQLFYVKLAFVDASLLSLGWIFFTILLAGQSQFLNRKVVAALTVPALLSSVLVVLNPYEWFVLPVNGGYAERIYGPVFWLSMAFIIVNALMSLYVIYVALTSNQAQRIKNQIMYMLRGIVAVCAFIMLDVFFNVILDDYLPVIPGFTSLGIVVSATFFVITIHQDKVFDIVTIAHQDIINTMEYGVLVLDDQEQVVEINQALHPYITLDTGAAFNISSYLPDGPDEKIEPFLRSYRDDPLETAGTEILYPVIQMYISIHAAPIMVSGIRVGRIVTFQNITEIHRLIDETNHQNTILQERNAALIKVQEELFQTNAKLRKLAITDSLTGCYNRHYLMQQLEQEVLRTGNSLTPSTIILIDIDFFKKINDQYGHMAGDVVICSTVELLQRSLRPSDILARYGGEEFIIYLPDTDEAGARLLAEQLKTNVEHNSINIDYIDEPVSITISMGLLSIGEFKVPPGMDATTYLNDLLKSADKALYAAKHQGRNQIVSARQ